MTPALIEAAFAALNGILAIIAEAKAQGALTDDAIMARAEAQTATNAELYKSLIAGL